MKKTGLFILAVVILAALFTGCDLLQSVFGTGSLIGTWSIDFDNDGDGQVTRQTWEFTNEGTGIDSLTWTADPLNDQPAGTDTITFSYTESNGTLNLIYVSQVSITGRTYTEDGIEMTYVIDGNTLSLSHDGSTRVYTKE